jgi:undecaprenyl-diphosphatase
VTPLHAIVLGIVQGLTEFLPVSSSGHLLLVPVLLGWPDQGLAFDAAIHLGTSLALLCWFGRDLARLAADILARRGPATRLGLAIVVGSIPAGLVGLLYEHRIEAAFRSAQVVAWSMIVWGLVLWWADRRAARATVADLRGVGVWRGVAVGGAQVLALVPGTSRSGITMTAGLFTGLDRPTAARFAFLLGLPLTAAAGLLHTVKLLRVGLAAGESALLGIGLLTSFLAGVVAVGFLLRFLQRRSLAVFVIYRLALGLLLLALVAGGRLS